MKLFFSGENRCYWCSQGRKGQQFTRRERQFPTRIQAMALMRGSVNKQTALAECFTWAGERVGGSCQRLESANPLAPVLTHLTTARIAFLTWRIEYPLGACLLITIPAEGSGCLGMKGSTPRRGTWGMQPLARSQVLLAGPLPWKWLQMGSSKCCHDLELSSECRSSSLMVSPGIDIFPREFRRKALAL